MSNLKRLPYELCRIIDTMLHPVDRIMVRTACWTKQGEIVIREPYVRYILANRYFRQFEYLRDKINNNIHRQHLVFIAIQCGIPAIEYLGITVDEIKKYKIRLEDVNTFLVAKYLYDHGLEADTTEYSVNPCVIATHGDIELYDWYYQVCDRLHILGWNGFSYVNIPVHMLDHMVDRGHLFINDLACMFVYTVKMLNHVRDKYNVVVTHNQLVRQAIDTCDHELRSLDYILLAAQVILVWVIG
jgi:hypothetical protein